MEATLQSGRRRTIRSLFFSTRPSLVPKTRRERTTRHSHSEETPSRAVSSCRVAAPARAAARAAQPLQRHGALLPLGQRRDPRPGRRRLELAAARFQVHALRGPSVIIGRRINDQRSEISGDPSDLDSWAFPPLHLWPATWREHKGEDIPCLDLVTTASCRTHRHACRDASSLCVIGRRARAGLRPLGAVRAAARRHVVREVRKNGVSHTDELRTSEPLRGTVVSRVV